MIGFVLFASAVPIVVLEYPLGKAIPTLRYQGVFTYGFLLIALAMGAAALMHSSSLIYALLIASAVGAAFVEPAAEAHFFAITRRDDETLFFGIWYTSQHLGMLLARLVGAILILLVGLESLLLPFATIFFVLALTIRR